MKMNVLCAIKIRFGSIPIQPASCFLFSPIILTEPKMVCVLIRLSMSRACFVAVVLFRRYSARPTFPTGKTFTSWRAQSTLLIVVVFDSASFFLVICSNVFHITTTSLLHVLPAVSLFHALNGGVFVLFCVWFVHCPSITHPFIRRTSRINVTEGSGSFSSAKNKTQTHFARRWASGESFNQIAASMYKSKRTEWNLINYRAKVLSTWLSSWVFWWSGQVRNSTSVPY